MSKLFHHVAGHKPAAQKQLCSFNPTSFSQNRAEADGRLCLRRAFTACISKVPRKVVEQILITGREKKKKITSHGISVRLVPSGVAQEMV